MILRAKKSSADFRAELNKRWAFWAIVAVAMIALAFAVGLLALLISIPLVSFAINLCRHKARIARPELTQADIENGILLLRPFAKDRKSGGGIRHSPVARQLGLVGMAWQFSPGSLSRTFEEVIVPPLEETIGAVFALGSPQEKLPAPGARRFYASDDEWQEVVQRFAREARFIIVVAGCTENVARELRYLREQITPAKVFLLVEPMDRDRWPEICEAFTRSGFQLVADDPGPGSLIAFDDEWRPLLIGRGLSEGTDFSDVFARWINSPSKRATEMLTKVESTTTPEWSAPVLERPIKPYDLGDVRNFGGRANQVTVVMVTIVLAAVCAYFVGGALGLRGGAAALIVAAIMFLPVAPVYLGLSSLARLLSERGKRWAMPLAFAVIVPLFITGLVAERRHATEQKVWAELQEHERAALAALGSGDPEVFRNEWAAMSQRLRTAVAAGETEQQLATTRIAVWEADTRAMLTSRWDDIVAGALPNKGRVGQLANLLESLGMREQVSKLTAAVAARRERLAKRGVLIVVTRGDLSDLPEMPLINQIADGTIAALREQLGADWELDRDADTPHATMVEMTIDADVTTFDDGNWPQIPTFVRVTLSRTAGKAPALLDEKVFASGEVEAVNARWVALGLSSDLAVPWEEEDARAANQHNIALIVDRLKAKIAAAKKAV
jgi:hypothetical protein